MEVGEATRPEGTVIVISHPIVLTGLLNYLGDLRVIDMANIGEEMMLDLKI
jgi:broad specificity phosphatase PhoE